MRDFRSDRYNNSRSRKDFTGQSGATNTQTIDAVFQEPVHRVLVEIRNEPYFKWPNKMVGESTSRNQNLYCQYHQDHGHTTENCKNLWSYLDQLVQEGKLRHLLHHSSRHQGQAHQEPQKDNALGPPAGMINVILATPGRIGMRLSRMLTVARLPDEESQPKPKRLKGIFTRF
nr:uncharacterized protein LOC111996947 [Quercus suber]